MVVMGTPTVPTIENTLAMDVKQPPLLSVRPEICREIGDAVKQYLEYVHIIGEGIFSKFMTR